MHDFELVQKSLELLALVGHRPRDKPRQTASAAASTYGSRQVKGNAD